MSLNYSQNTVFWDFFADGKPGLVGIFSNVVSSLTYNYLQNSNSFQQFPIIRPVMGTVQTEIPYVLVRWPWIALPVTLNVIGAGSFLTTAVYTHKLGLQLWKSSAMALVYH